MFKIKADLQKYLEDAGYLEKIVDSSRPSSGFGKHPILRGAGWKSPRRVDFYESRRQWRPSQMSVKEKIATTIA